MGFNLTRIVDRHVAALLAMTDFVVVVGQVAWPAPCFFAGFNLTSETKDFMCQRL